MSTGPSITITYFHKPVIVNIAAGIASIVFSLAGVLFCLIVQPGPSGVIASLRLPDGSEYMITQRCNWSAEPYTVSFYMRPADGPWGWCYIDHEAGRWWNVHMFWDQQTDTIVVTELGVRRAVLDRKRRTFWIDNGSQSRELAAPQDYHEPGFPFPLP